MSKKMQIGEHKLHKTHAPRINMYKEYESNLNQIRFEKNLTIKELADMSNVTVQTISGLFNGTISPLSNKGEIKKVVKRLCEVLECDFAEAFPRYFCKLQTSNDILYCQLVEEQDSPL